METKEEYETRLNSNLELLMTERRAGRFTTSFDADQNAVKVITGPIHIFIETPVLPDFIKSMMTILNLLHVTGILADENQ